MSANTAPSLNALQQLMAIRDYVLDAQRQLKAGRMPDMTALEAQTSDLCRIIREASSDVQQQCAPELKELARQLDDCEEELRAFYTTLPLPQDH
jgi:hypothetical protein